MSGLLALLDDVAAIAKVAATSLDDVLAQSAKAGAKAAGAAIDDAAVTPRYVQGFDASRELPNCMAHCQRLHQKQISHSPACGDVVVRLRALGHYTLVDAGWQLSVF